MKDDDRVRAALESWLRMKESTEKTLQDFNKAKDSEKAARDKVTHVLKMVHGQTPIVYKGSVYKLDAECRLVQDKLNATIYPD